MKIHPLRRVYNEMIRERYHHSVWSDPNPCQTEALACKLDELGVPYGVYVDAAIRMWAGYARRQGWPYVYWNVVAGQKTLDKISKLLDLGTKLQDDDCHDGFELEVAYATDYIAWMHGDLDAKPKRCAEADLSLRTKVARYLCQVFGIPYQTPNYNDIAMRTSHG